MTGNRSVTVIGAGAAGLATAIFLGRNAPNLRVTVLDGARTPGAKILVSGGSRCNVTNVAVTEHDYNGGRPAIIRRILRAFPETATVDFFRDLGVPLHEEADGKLFPDTNRSRDVLNALLRGLSDAGVALKPNHRVHEVTQSAAPDGGFALATSQGALHSDVVVLATGGLSLPKTGSDGLGYEFAKRLGHTIVATTPALAPLRFDQTAGAWHRGLSGVAMPVRLRVSGSQRTEAVVDGAMLWTHFGISGPAALDVSRHWLRLRLDGEIATLHANLLGETFEAAEARWLSMAAARPKQALANAAAALVPAAVAQAMATHCDIPPERTLAELSRTERRAVVHTLTDWPLPIADSRGYDYAEVTAGGVTLTEIDPATMQSRATPGLFLVGEVLDVDGRLGGFNFQWAWSSAFVAARGIRARLDGGGVEGNRKA